MFHKQHNVNCWHGLLGDRHQVDRAEGDLRQRVDERAHDVALALLLRHALEVALQHLAPQADAVGVGPRVHLSRAVKRCHVCHAASSYLGNVLLLLADNGIAEVDRQLPDVGEGVLVRQLLVAHVQLADYKQSP